MTKKIIEFDSKSLSFGKVSSKASKFLGHLLIFLIVTLLLTIIVYLLFALFFRTDTERQLKREISMYQRVYPMFAPKERMIGDAISLLQYKDNDIYGQVFHSIAPSVDPMSSLGFVFTSDTIPDTKWTSYTRDKSDQLIATASKIDEAFVEIYEALATNQAPPPMLLPIKNIHYPQIGASIGQKYHPFYNAYVMHDGLDIIVTRGIDVLATGDGTVINASSSRTLGNTIEISHAGGYKTVYAHLEKMNVRKGQNVKAGQRIGSVGMSGKASAPHLHYEVRRDSLLLNPIDCIFAAVSPEEYANMLYMSVNTKQSMD